MAQIKKMRYNQCASQISEAHFFAKGMVIIMIFADKLIILRKKNGWSQEELAEKLDVSRQAVSKWEGAQCLPDIEKVIMLSELFGVTTDFLLRDENEITDISAPENITAPDEANSEKLPDIKKMDVSEAERFMDFRKRASIKIAVATFLCILSTICLFILAALSEIPDYGLSEEFAAAVGLAVMFVIVGIACALYISISSSVESSKYGYVEKGAFSISSEVRSSVENRMREYEKKHRISNIIGVCICVLSPIPLVSGGMLDNDLVAVACLSITMALAGVGVFFFIKAGVIWASFQKLLKEGEYDKEKTDKKKRSVLGVVAGVYWITITAVFLSIYFFYDINDNMIYGYFWTIAGLVFAAVMMVFGYIERNRKK